MQEEKPELEKAIELVEKEGRLVVLRASVLGEHDPIREICGLLDGAGYRVISAKLDREKGDVWHGEINLSVLSRKQLERTAEKL